MLNSEILFLFGSWGLVSIVILVFTDCIKTKSRFELTAGALFLIATILGLLIIYLKFSKDLNCEQVSCMDRKYLISTFSQFLTITWGSFGGTLFANAISGKRRNP